MAYPTQQDGKIAFHADGESRAFTQALRTSRPTWRSWNWDAFTLHRVNEVGLVPDAFEAFTSFPKPDGARIKIRWTLSRRAFDGTYAITGWTDLGTGIGSDFEVALSMISHSTGAGLDRLLLNLRSLPDAHRALDERRFDDARKHLDTAARARPRGEFGDVYELVEARFDLLSGIGNEGVSPVDRLDALLFENPANLPALMLQIRAMADDRQFEAIADLARRYQDIAGPDADALAWSGLAEAEQERPDEARDLFEQALKLDPSQATAIVGLLELMTDADKVAFVDRLAGRKTFRGLFHRLMDNTALEDPKTTELLARAHRRGFPDDHSAARHLVRALMMRDQFAAAIEVFQKSIAELADEPREKLLSEFLESSTSKKRQREAYDAVPAGDREEAFRSVMRSWSYWLIDSDDVEPEQAAQRNAIREKYATLLELHEKTRADDDWVLIYRAKEANRSGPHRG